MDRLPWREGRDYTVKVAAPYRQSFNDAAGCKTRGVAEHPDYHAAKYDADTRAALRVVETAMNRIYVAQLKIWLNEAKLNNIQDPIIICPYKESSPNRLARTAAAYLGKELGLQVDTQVIENPGPSTKELSKLERIFTTPDFSGEIHKGKWYIIVDDNVQTGSKMAALRSYIVANGGRFMFGCALSSLSGQNVTLNASESQIASLSAKLSKNVIEWFERTSHVAISGLTKAEADFLEKPPGRKELIGFAAKAGLFQS